MTTRKASYSYQRRHNTGTYRSGLEEVNSDLLKTFSIEPKYEQYYLEYVVPESKHKYTPDFVLPNGIIIETKGVWDAEDRKKHMLIKEQHPNLDIRFVFSRSATPISKGSKTTYASFCDKNENNDYVLVSKCREQLLGDFVRLMFIPAETEEYLR